MNTKRYWLRGMVIGFVASVALIGVSMLRLPCPDFIEVGGIRLGQSVCTYVRLLNPLRVHYPFPRLLNEWIPLFIVLIVIGAFLGWIYGRIKNRNK